MHFSLSKRCSHEQILTFFFLIWSQLPSGLGGCFFYFSFLLAYMRHEFTKLPKKMISFNFLYFFFFFYQQQNIWHIRYEIKRKTKVTFLFCFLFCFLSWEKLCQFEKKKMMIKRENEYDFVIFNQNGCFTNM